MDLMKNSLALDTLAASITDYHAIYFAGGVRSFRFKHVLHWRPLHA
jgi:hypothetical protein